MYTLDGAANSIPVSLFRLQNIYLAFSSFSASSSRWMSVSRMNFRDVSAIRAL